MTQEEIITRLIDLLDLHLQGGFESVNQDPYKNDIFKLFREPTESATLSLFQPQ
jgi:hypothetical protein